MTATAPPTRKNPWAALVVLCIANFLILLDTTIVNAAVPKIITSLGTGIDAALWVLNAYLLAFASLLIIFGRLGDTFGPRRLFVIGMVLFGAASLACGLSMNSAELITARAVQGVGAAILVPQALVLITMIFPPERRGTALGVFVAVAGLAAISGPTIGGLLITDLGWQWIFYLNIPVCVVGVVLTYLLVPNLRLGRPHRFDVVGVVLATVGLIGVVYGLIESPSFGWGVSSVIIVVSVLILAAFVFWEARQTEPLVPLALFRSRTFSLASAITVITNFGLFGFVLIFVIETQSVLGMTALKGGIVVLPMSIMLAILAPFSGQLANLIGGRTMLVVGLAMYAIGVLGIAFLPSPTSSATVFILPLIIIGFGMGLALAPATAMALGSVQPQRLGAASGVLNTSRQVGGALGAAVIGSVLQANLIGSMRGQAATRAAQLPAAARQSFLTAFDQSTQHLRLGAGQGGGISAQSGNLPPGLANQIAQISHDSFTYGFIDAAKPTLGVIAVVMLLGSVLALFVKPPSGPPQAAPQPRPAAGADVAAGR